MNLGISSSQNTTETSKFRDCWHGAYKQHLIFHT